jgi:hypothetical protein
VIEFGQEMGPSIVVADEFKRFELRDSHLEDFLDCGETGLVGLLCGAFADYLGY